MKTTQTLITLGLIISAAFSFPKDSQSHMNMMKHKDGQMMHTTQGVSMTVKLPSVQCGMCKNTIETGISKVAGIRSVNVDMDHKTAEVIIDPEVIDAQGVEHSIAELGYWANETPADPAAYHNLDGCCQMTEAEYDQLRMKSETDHSTPDKTDGMKILKNDAENQAMVRVSLPTIQCGMCESRIERELPKTAGIQSVDVILENHMGHIVYDPEVLTLPDIEKAIAQIGYQANTTPADAMAYHKLPGCCKVR